MAQPQLDKESLKVLREIADQYDDINNSASTYVTNLNTGLNKLIKSQEDLVEKSSREIDNIETQINLLQEKNGLSTVAFNAAVKMKESIQSQIKALESEAIWDDVKLENLNDQLSRQNDIEKSANNTLNANEKNINSLQKNLKTQNDLLFSTQKQLNLDRSLVGVRTTQLNLLGDSISNFEEVNKSAGKLISVVKGLINPYYSFLTLLVLTTDRFKQLDTAAEGFRKETGLLAGQTQIIENNVRDISRDFQEFGVDINEAYIAAKSLTEVFGDKFIASNKQNVEHVSLLSNNLGVAAEDSAKVLNSFMGIGKLSSQTSKYLAGQVVSLTKAAGIPLNKIMHDVANASGETLSLLKGSVTALIRGSVEAKRLGSDINTISAAASHLLDFQASIGDELEASVLMGKDLNLQKARELAYAGDLAGLAKEQSNLIMKAGRLDFYQQHAMAKALGLNVEQVMKMQAKQQELSELRQQDPEFAKQYEKEMQKIQDLTKLNNSDLRSKYELEMKTQQIQSEQTKLANQFKALLVDISDVLVPVTRLLFQVANILVYILKPVGLIFKFAGAIVDSFDHLFTISTSWEQKLNNISSTFSVLFDNIKSVGIGPWIGLLAVMLISVKKFHINLLSAIVSPFKYGLIAAKNYFSSILSFSSKIPIVPPSRKIPKSPKLPTPKPGKSIPTPAISTQIFDTIKKIKPKQILSVGLAMIMFAGSMYILAKAGQEFNSVDWSSLGKMGAVAGGLLAFTAAIALMGPVIGTVLPKVGIGLILLAGAMYILAKAAQQFDSINWDSLGKMGAVAGGLIVFTGAIILMGSALTAAAPAVGVALLVIGGLTLSLIGIGYASTLFGKGIAIVIDSLANLKSTSIGNIASDLIKLSGAMFLFSASTPGLVAFTGGVLLFTGAIALMGASIGTILPILGSGLILFASGISKLTNLSKDLSAIDWSVFVKIGAITSGLLVFTATIVLMGSALTAALPVVGGALLAIGGLTIGLLGIGYATTLFATGINLASSALSNLKSMSIDKIASDLVKLSSSMFLFGSSMMSAGFMTFAGSGLFLQLAGLATISPMLFIAAKSLDLVGESLKSFDSEAVKNIKSITDAIKELNSEINKVNLLKVGTLAALNISSGKSSISTQSDNKAVVDKLNELINLMSSGGIAVNIDGAKASHLLSKAQKERGAFGAV